MQFFNCGLGERKSELSLSSVKCVHFGDAEMKGEPLTRQGKLRNCFPSFDMCICLNFSNVVVKTLKSICLNFAIYVFV